MKMALQLRFGGSRELTKMFRWRNNEGDSRVLSVLAEFCCFVKISIESKGEFLGRVAAVCFLGL